MLPKDRQPGPEPSVQDLLKALLVLLNDEREAQAASRSAQVRVEVLLANAGFDYKTVAAMLGKNADAVRMAITRAKAPTKKTGGKSNRVGPGQSNGADSDG